jgi:hypothetical protein
MKNQKLQLLPALVLLLSVFSWTSAHAQITPLGDAYTNSADPTTNYGSKTLLDVDGATQITYIQFNLASIPSGAAVSQATLKLYVNAVSTPGSFNVDYVNGTWAEGTIDASNAPPLGNTVASNLAITKTDVNQYILIDVTSALQAWLNGNETNNGIALVANSSFNATFDSKENTTTSHPAELDVVFAGDGTITGVTTAGGSGLIGGGTGGTLNLSLTNACSTNQVLQWNSSVWTCSNAGTGTITGVTAGTGLSGGGTSGSVPLSINPSVVPQLNSANSFTGNQTVNGSVSATGMVSSVGGFQIGGYLFGYGLPAVQSAFLGFAGSTGTVAQQNTGVGYGALGIDIGDSSGDGCCNTAVGYIALENTNDSSSQGPSSLAANNTAVGYGTLAENTTGSGNTATGFLALSNNLTGSVNTAFGSYAGTLGFTGQITGSSDTFIGYWANPSAGALSNATAIGANAEVAESNALVLGSINGVNLATASVNVGIGTTTPQAALDINANNGAGGLDTYIGAPCNGSASFAGIAFWTTGKGFQNCTNYALMGDSEGSTYINAPSNQIVFRNNNAGSPSAMTIASNSYVGIGVNAPTNLLTLRQGGGAAIADGWNTYSSRRWKTNIRPLQNALTKVEQLRGVSYELKDSGKHEIGVIAEEVGQVVPEVVSYEANGKDARGVDYSRLTALLIEAVKQQQQEITALRTQLRNRVAKEASLELRLAEIERHDETTHPKLASVRKADNQ